MLLGPLLRTAQPQEVTVVLKQFSQAGARDTRELDLGFFGSARSFAAFENILFTRSRGLHHLVVSAVGFSQEPLAEAHSAVKDYPGLLEGEQILVATVRRDEVLGGEFLLFRRTQGTKMTQVLQA